MFIELLPLPSPNTATWLYSSLSSLPKLQSRKTYLAHYSPLRIQRIRALVAEYQPSVVVFYGLGCLPLWQTVADSVLQSSEPAGVYMGHHGSSTFVAMKHPAARGVTNAYFQRVGQVIANLVLDQGPGYELLTK